MAGEVELTVGAEHDGERLDKALAALLDVSRAQSRLLVETGVYVDGELAKAGDRVRQGSKLVSPQPEDDPGLQPEPVAFDVLYEDDQVVVVNKPPGLVVHPGSGRAGGTLAAGLLHRYPDIEGVGAPGRWGLVHRLDKDTSGALAVGRTSESHNFLTEELQRREIERRYITLVDGELDAPTGAIDAPIGRDPLRPTRRAVVVGGKAARTRFAVRQVFAESECSLLDVTLETGRTHQIRVHFSAIDHPVIGDRLYGRRPTKASSPRVFLHASSLAFTHPTRGERLTIESPLPDDLAQVLDRLL